MDQSIAIGQRPAPVEPPVGGVARPAEPPVGGYLSTDPSAAKLRPGQDVSGLMNGSGAPRVGQAPDQPPPNLNDPNGPLAAGVSQFFGDLNPVPVAEVVARAVAANPLDPVGSAVSAIVNPMIAQAAQRVAAAKEAIANGDHNGAVIHFVGAIPIIGPAMDDLASAVRAGDHAKAAKALGDLAALSGPTLLSGGAEAAGEAAASRFGVGPAAADAAQAGAESRIASTIDPANNWGKTRKAMQQASQADDVAPAVLAAGPMAVTRAGLRDFIGQGFQSASDAWDAAEANRQVGRPMNVRPIIAQLQAKVDALTSQPIEGSLPQRADVTTTSPILDPSTGQPIQTTSQVAQPIGQAVSSDNVSPQIAVLQKAIAQLKQLGGPNGLVNFEALRTMRQGADAGANYKEAIGVTSDANNAAKQSALGNRGVAGALRDAMAAADPDLAKANANFSIWQKANDVAQAAGLLDRSATKGGNFATTARLMAPLLGMQGGYLIGGGEGGALGAAGGLLGAAMDAASRGGFTTKVATARVLDTLASAIKAGDASAVARTMAALASVTGTAVPVVNQSLSGLGGPQIQIPQDPINVNVAANRGGGS